MLTRYPINATATISLARLQWGLRSRPLRSEGSTPSLSCYIRIDDRDRLSNLNKGNSESIRTHLNRIYIALDHATVDSNIMSLFTKVLANVRVF